MNTQATSDCMHKKKLNAMANNYEAILDLPADKQPSNHECIANLVEAELLHRSDKKTSMPLRLSKLRYSASLHDLSYTKQRNLSKQTMG